MNMTEPTDDELKRFIEDVGADALTLWADIVTGAPRDVIGRKGIALLAKLDAAKELLPHPEQRHG